MKVLIIERLPGQPITDSSLLSLLTDSSIVYPRRPLFLPPFSQEWEMTLAPAIEICRQGKYIGQRFAARYAGRLAAAARLLPAGTSLPASAMLTAFDGALAIGPWLEMPDGICGPITLAAASAGQETISPEDLAPDEAIAWVSRRFTLRTGDILIPALTRVRPRVAIDTRVETTINGSEALSLKIK